MKKQESIETRMVLSILRFVKRIFSRAEKRSKKTNINHAEISRRWNDIEGKLKLNSQSNFQSAVIDADKLLDYCLQNLGARGETTGERLKDFENKFYDRASYQAAWEGHKERNRLVHEHDYEFLYHQATLAIDNFKQALKGIRVL